MHLAVAALEFELQTRFTVSDEEPEHLPAEPEHLPPDPEPTKTESAETEPAAGGNRRLKLTAAILAALAVALAFIAAIQTSRLNAERNRSAEIRRVAAAMGSALQTYDYRKIAETKRNVLNLATGSFKRDYQDFPGELGEVIRSEQLISSVREIEVYLSEVGEAEATAIVVADTLVRSRASQPRGLVSYIQLDLVRAGGQWRVSGLTSLNLGQPTPGAEPAATTTTTTVPKD